MIEVERKYRLTAVQYRQLLNAFATTPDSVQTITQQHDTILLWGATSFADFKPGAPVVRLRQAGEVNTLTVKRKINIDGDAHELETEIGSPSQMSDILRLAGFNIVSTVEKSRTEFSRDSVTIAFDDVNGIGLFVELEVLADEASYDVAVHQIQTTAVSLGLTDDQVETQKYDQLAAKISDR
jgi:adenylate cyclase class 2